MKSKHTGLGHNHRQIKTELESISQQNSIATGYPIIEGPVHPFAGLAVHQNAGCPYCSYAASAKVVQKHIRQQHPFQTGKPVMNIAVQVLNAGSSPSYFRVEQQGSFGVEQDLVQELLDFDWKDRGKNNTTTPNARMVSPWLMRTGWHIYVQGHDSKQLKDFVSMPKQGEFEGLQSTILEYFEQATKLIDHTDELVLQRINTADPRKE